MYDIEKDVENVAEYIYQTKNGVVSPPFSKIEHAHRRMYLQDAREILGLLSAVAELKELQERYDAQDSLLASVLETNTAMGRRLKELETAIMDMGLTLTKYHITENIDVYKRLASR